MNKSGPKWLKILGAIVAIILLVIGLFAFSIKLFVDNFVHGYDAPMAEAQKYMDSLSERDFQAWADRTKKYLDEYDPKADEIGAKPVPPELKQLKISGIDEGSNWVSYVWIGGLDHTELYVKRMADGMFQFTAIYNDESNRVIWPKTPK